MATPMKPAPLLCFSRFYATFQSGKPAGGTAVQRCQSTPATSPCHCPG